MKLGRKKPSERWGGVLKLSPSDHDLMRGVFCCFPLFKSNTFKEMPEEEQTVVELKDGDNNQRSCVAVKIMTSCTKLLSDASVPTLLFQQTVRLVNDVA